MASIVKRKNKYSVVYTYQDEKGEKRQKWETFATNAEAKKRKAEVEFQQESGTLVIPEAKTVKELLEDYTSIYGVNTWAMSTYEARRSLIFNYINPIIGDMKLSDLNTRVMEKYYQNLLKVKSRVVNNRKPNNEYLSCHVVREIHKLLRCAFNQAVKWELMAKNPCINATLPKEEHKTRDIWDAPTLFKALELCDDDILKLAINLAFSCSLRMGEMLGLTWDCVEISDASMMYTASSHAPNFPPFKDISFTVSYVGSNNQRQLMEAYETGVQIMQLCMQIKQGGVQHNAYGQNDFSTFDPTAPKNREEELMVQSNARQPVGDMTVMEMLLTNINSTQLYISMEKPVLLHHPILCCPKTD